MGDNILFKHKATGKYFTFSENGKWTLTSKADVDEAKYENIYEFVNEIMEDHNLLLEDIEIIDLNKYKEKV